MKRFGASGELSRETTRLARARLQQKIQKQLARRRAVHGGIRILDRSLSAKTSRHVAAGWRTRVFVLSPNGANAHVSV